MCKVAAAAGQRQAKLADTTFGGRSGLCEYENAASRMKIPAALVGRAGLLAECHIEVAHQSMTFAINEMTSPCRATCAEEYQRNGLRQAP